MNRQFIIEYERIEESSFYVIQLREEGTILAKAAGIDENTVLHMFVSLATAALLNIKNPASLNDRLSILERFASEIVFKRNI